LTDSGVVAELRQQICHVVVDRRANDDPAEIELRLGNSYLIHRDGRLELG